MKIQNGIDAVEIARIKKLMNSSSFTKKILGEEEYKYYKSKGMRPESIAGAFCAKEAFSKAIGTGVRKFSLSEVQVLHDRLGRPYFKFTGKAAKIVKRKRLKFTLSITHTDTSAFAVVTATRKFFF